MVQEEPLATAKLQMVSKGKVLPLDQAIHLSIDCACKSLSLATSLCPAGTRVGRPLHSEAIVTLF